MSDWDPGELDEFDRRAAARRERRGERSPSWGPATPGRRRPSLRTLLIALPVVLFLWLLLSLFEPFKGDGYGHVSVRIPRGAGTGKIADILDSQGVVDSGALFQVRLTLAGKRGDVQAGTYRLARDMSYGSAIDALTAPPAQRTLSVTIPEGLARPEIAPIVRRARVRGDYLQASVRAPGLDPRTLGGRGARSLEGFLFPATYELKAGATASQLVAKQLQAFRQNFARVSLKSAKRKNLTAYDVLTIASMIEREVSSPHERRLVAAVIYNRLHAGEPLGIDATVRFATGNWTRPLTSSQLAVDSRYNTRRRAGLPPGPIGNPGLAAIQAAANPAHSRAFYYVVKPNTCNRHVFTSSQQAFERASAAYERARRRNGGRAPTTCPGG